MLGCVTERIFLKTLFWGKIDLQRKLLKNHVWWAIIRVILFVIVGPRPYHKKFFYDGDHEVTRSMCFQNSLA